jgi:hypothetical protein
MNLAVLGGFGERPIPPGWTNETAVAILGGGDIDLTQSPPGESARLRPSHCSAESTSRCPREAVSA